MDYHAIIQAFQKGIMYLPVTLRLSFIPLVIGSVLGLGFALIRFYNIRFFSHFLKIIFPILKGIPVVLVLIVAYLVFSDWFDQLAVALQFPIRFKDINREYLIIVILSGYATIQLTEVFRGLLLQFDRTQLDAAASIGLTTRQTIMRIILPQLWFQSLPLLCNQWIVLLKLSALASIVSVVDILSGSLITATTSYTFLEAYIAAAVIYWILAIIIEQMGFFLERRPLAKRGGI